MPRVFKPLGSGELRLMGDIERLIPAVDAAGGPTTQYETFATGVRFSISDWRATEVNASQQIVSQVVTYIVIRYRPGIEPTMRVKHVSEWNTLPPTVDYYDIQGLLRDPTARWALQLACVKRDASGYRTGTIP